MIDGPYKIPKGWRWVRLGEVCEIIMGQSPPSKSYNTTGRGLPFFQGKADFGELYPNPRVWCDAPKKIARMDDILISVRAPVGAVNIAKETCCIGRGLAALRLKAEGELFWLFFYLRFIEKYLAEKGSGSTFKAITKKDLETLLIPLPPLDEQKRIVARLEELMSKIKEVKRLRKETKKQTELLWQSILAETFPKPGTQLPNGWQWVKLGDVVITSSGNSKLIKGRLHSEPEPGFYPGFSASGQDVWLPFYEHEGEAIILSAVGARCGKCFLAKGKWTAIANTHIIWPRTELVDIHFLFYLINDERFWIRGQSAQPFVKVGESKKKLIPLPPLEEQKRIANCLQEVHEKIKELKEDQTKTEEEIKFLEQSILEKAFRGEL
jgi:type I restriction enzyme S subunit